MSLPPQILRIKRKIHEEPVEALYLQQKRRRTTVDTTQEHDFVFRRVIAPRKPSAAVPRSRQPAAPLPPDRSASGVPQLLTTRPGEETGFIARLREAEASAKASKQKAQSITVVAPAASAIPAAVPTSPPISASTPARAARRFPTIAPRRFHLSKATSATLNSQSRKRKADVAVFVSEEAEGNASASTQEAADRPEKMQKMLSEQSETARPRKRPGATSSTAGTPRKTEIKEADPEMQDALQAYAMEEFGITYGQRMAAHSQPDPDVTMSEEKDDDEYIYDTYMRHDASDVVMSDDVANTSAHQPGKAATPGAGTYGILVIPEEQHELFLETFGEDATSEDEGDWDSEQDDENAENYYAADYPEDEVDSDDERGYGAYEKYRTTGGDLSEEDEEVYSEEERTAAKRYPWLTQMRRDATQGDAHESDEDEEEE